MKPSAPQKHSRFEAFVSLAWYEVFLRFVANFVAKSAELLLAAGLITSSANFLTDGAVLGTGSAASDAWSWTQALAIDASLGISFYYVLHCLKQRDWVKFALYSILTLILTVVAGIITEGDIFSHAIHAPIHDAMGMLGIDVRLLSILRAIAVVGFVLMSRLRDVSFKDLTTPEEETGSPAPSATNSQIQAGVPDATAPQFSVEDVAHLLQALVRTNGTTITEVPTASIGARQDRDTAPRLPQGAPESAMPAVPMAHFDGSPLHLVQQTSARVTAPEPSVQVPPSQSDPQQVPQDPIALAPSETAPEPQDYRPSQQVLSGDREERLERAYHDLLAEGQKITGRTLAKRAHVHRTTCIVWLRARAVASPEDTPGSARQSEQITDVSEPENQEPEEQGRT